MVLRVFCGNANDREHEWEQFIEIYLFLKAEFPESKVIYLLYNFKLETYQIDLLIIQNTGIAILELKSYKGKVFGNSDFIQESRNYTPWYVETTSGRVDLPRNLYRQLLDEKNKLYDVLVEHGNFNNTIVRNLRKIQAWGYFKEESEYEKNQLDPKHYAWFDVITKDSLLRKLRFVDMGTRLSIEQMDKIVELLQVGRCPSDDIRLTPHVDYMTLTEEWMPKFQEASIKYITTFKQQMRDRGEVESDLSWIYTLTCRNVDKKRVSSDNLTEIIKSQHSSIIFGRSGTGKTIFNHQIFDHYSNIKEKNKNESKDNFPLVPVLIKLRNINIYKSNEDSYLRYFSKEILIKNIKSLDQDFMRHVTGTILYSHFSEYGRNPMDQNPDTFIKLFEKLFTQNHFTLILDGFDETSGITRDFIIQWLDYITFSSVKWYLSSRYDYETQLSKFVDNAKFFHIELPNSNQAELYLEHRRKYLKIDKKVVLDDQLSPLQLFVQSYYSFKLSSLNKYFQGLVLVYGHIIWEHMHDPEKISKLDSIENLVQFLRSETIQLNNKEFSIYDLIHVSSNLIAYDSLMSVCGDLAYKSLQGAMDNDVIDNLFARNPLTDILTEIRPTEDLSKSYLRFKTYHLNDLFAAYHIYEQFKNQNLVPLLNTEVMIYFIDILNNFEPWMKYDNLKQYGNSTVEVLGLYLTKFGVDLISTEFLPKFDGDGTTMVTRTHMGVPKWFELLIEGILSELSKARGTDKESILYNLNDLLRKIPELTSNQTYDLIIKDWDFETNLISESKEPWEYEEQIRKMFPQFAGDPPEYIMEIFSELNDNVSDILDIETSSIQDNNDYFFNDLDQGDVEEDFDQTDNDDEWFYEYEDLGGYYAKKSAERISFYINLLESDIHQNIKLWALRAVGYTLWDFHEFIEIKKLRSIEKIPSQTHQYFCMKLLQVAKNEDFGRYALNLWWYLLRGEDLGDGIVVPGPKPIWNYIEQSINLIIKRDDEWIPHIKILFGWLLPKKGVFNGKLIEDLLFGQISKKVSSDVFTDLVIAVTIWINEYNISDSYSDEQFENKNDIEFLYYNPFIKQIKTWLPILTKHDFNVLSYLDLSVYDLDKSDFMSILVRWRELINADNHRVNPKLFEKLYDADIGLQWVDLLYNLGEKPEVDEIFRKLVKGLDEDQFIAYINTLDNSIIILEALLAARINLEHLEFFVRGYLGFHENDSNDLNLNIDFKLHKDTYKIENLARQWIFNEDKQIDFIVDIFSRANVQILVENDSNVMSLFTNPDYNSNKKDISKPSISNFWQKNMSEELLITLFEFVKAREHPYDNTTIIRPILPYTLEYEDVKDRLSDLFNRTLTQTQTFRIYSSDLVKYLNSTLNVLFIDIWVNIVSATTNIDSINQLIRALEYTIYKTDYDDNIQYDEPLNVHKKNLKVVMELVETIFHAAIKVHSTEHIPVTNDLLNLLNLDNKLYCGKIQDHLNKILNLNIELFWLEYYLEFLLDEGLSLRFQDVVMKLKEELEGISLIKEDPPVKHSNLKKCLELCNKILDL